MEQLWISSAEQKETNITSCAFTGHRTLEEGITKERVINAVEQLIQLGAKTFYNGVAMGFDLLAAEAVIALKGRYSDIKLVVCIPCYGQEKNFSAEDKQRYVDIVKAADEQVMMSAYYYRGCMQVRDRYMVDRADVVLAYCIKSTGGAAFTVGYCKKRYPDKPIYYL
ncbi:MAG: DUF1273 family protein [Clostridia bacterium]|nr:DUF1273 family protein [Clostridia bacterium]